MIARKVSHLNYTPLFIVVDVLTLYLGAMPALLSGIGAHPAQPRWIHLIPIQLLCAPLIFWGCGLYRSWLRRPMADILILICAAGASLYFVWDLLLRWEPQFLMSPTRIMAIVLPQVILMIAQRGFLRGLIHRHERAGQSAIVATSEAAALQIRKKILARAPSWLTVDTCLTVEDLGAQADSELVWHSLLLASDVEDKASIVRRASRLGIHVLLLPNDFEIFLNGAQIQSVDDLLMVQLCPPFLQLPQRGLKRALDLFISVLLLGLAAPVMLVVAVLIRLTSPGAILFRQTRVGRDGVEFTVCKFRTMVADAEKQTGPVLATANDPRITPLGEFLRATRIDELPQLFNVLCGDMSLVGPRPERPHFVDQFREQLPGYEFRLAVKPGITGLAQVLGNYSTTAQRKLRFDLTYISQYSLLMDLRILLSTVAVVFRHQQAQGVIVADAEAEVAN